MSKCLLCGKPTGISLKKPKKFCDSVCRNKYHYEKSKNKTKCIVCGKVLAENRKKYCSKKCQDKFRSCKLAEERKEAFEEAKAFKKAKSKKPTKPKVSLEEVARLSKEAGMTAGQYVAKYGL